MKPIWIWKLKLTLLLLLNLVLAGCGGLNQSKVNMTFEVDPDPPGIGPSRLTVTLTNYEGTPVEGANLEIVGSMPQENMELRVKPRAETAGRYGAPFVWSASGDWVMSVKATLPGGQVAEREFPVTVEEKMSIDLAANSNGSNNHDIPERIPNDGAAVNILAPEDGASFEVGHDVKVEIETDNFILSEEGHHWHVYVNDQPGVMIWGGMTDAVLRNLEPGQYQISAYLSVGSHEELEEGDLVTITILEAEEQDMTMN